MMSPTVVRQGRDLLWGRFEPKIGLELELKTYQSPLYVFNSSPTVSSRSAAGHDPDSLPPAEYRSHNGYYRLWY